MITSAYWEAEDLAIEGNKDLTVETNLRNEFLIDRLPFFKSKGYTVNLVYMLLPDLQTSTDRVGLRVAQKGHFIDNESIKYNFEEGLIMLKKHFNKFDNVKIVGSSLDNRPSLPKTFLTLKNNHIHFINSSIPSWAKPLLDEIVQKLTTN